MALSRTIYNTLMKRNSAYVTTIFVGAFGFSIGFDSLTTTFWNNHNKGKQWADIRDKVVSG
ncbi:cytochrome b-c1 complex subunit 9 [Phakopsora pachyrhizi]|uniref:Complex III subunit 9 n=1 Tax=Phakopsora pachyrhizi TaxID=170000 RepID=A0AAV0BRP5_PHAPC|nr:cytochrome b-c1 complex subunit 9 [Phakopsora pachyrhizi]